MPGLRLTGTDLGLVALAEAAARTHPGITLSRPALTRMRRSRRIVEDIVKRGDAVYGVTTGLGARASERLSESELAAFSLRTIRGRAHAVGPCLSARTVRAAMIARLNTLLTGASGASLDTARHLQHCINRNLVPAIGETGSIGAGDLCWGASMALAMIGEGDVLDREGRPVPADDAFGAAGVAAFRPGPRDGLALANHSSFSAAIAALAVHDARRILYACQLAAAMSMEVFRANTGVIDSDVLAFRPQPGQDEAAAGLRHLLAGSRLQVRGEARRLQDPVSIRNVVQVHGSAYAALGFAEEAAIAELNGAGDNPVVLADAGTAVSSGNYFTPHLALAAGTLAQALANLAVLQLARLSKLMSARFTDLPVFLAPPGSDSNGFAPVMKIAEALVAEIRHLASPVDVWPSISADGVEDGLTNAPLAVRNLEKLLEKAGLLCAVELLVCAQGLELRKVLGTAAAPVVSAYEAIRGVSAPLTQDRPLGEDISRVAVLVKDGQL